MEKAKSLGEIAADDVISQVANFALLAAGPTCREPRKGNLLYTRKFSLSFEKSLKGGAKWTSARLNVPLNNDVLVRREAN